MSGKARSGWAKVPYALSHSVVRRKVNGKWQDKQLDARHAALYAQIQRWERDLPDGRRAPCCASWKTLLAAWPGAPNKRWVQILLREMKEVGWVREVPVKWPGATRRGLLTVREGEYQPLRAEIIPVGDGGSPLATSDVTPAPLTSPPMTSGSPAGDPEITQTREVLLDGDLTGPPPRAMAPEPPQGAGGVPAVPVVKRRRYTRRTTPLPPELKGLKLCGWLIGGAYPDEVLVQAVGDLRRSYCGDLSQVKFLTGAIESAILARSAGTPWAPRPTRAPEKPTPIGERLALSEADQAKRRQEDLAGWAELRQRLEGGQLHAV